MLNGTEARNSLRQSLKIFCQIQGSIQTNQHFEELCHLYSKKSLNGQVYPFSSSNEISCGNFVKCFTSLFLQKKDINRHSLNQIIDGGVVTQYINHLNILMYNQQENYFKTSCLSTSSQIWVSDTSQHISNWKSNFACKSLANQLLAIENDEFLPRIFICSITYVFPKLCTQQENNTVNDHKFIIIKHTNDNFQLLQNYISDEGNSNIKSRSAMTLRDWQENATNSFSSKNGFNKFEMAHFLSHLSHFAAGSLFNSSNYKKMFGVGVFGGVGENEYWPSVSHREIGDEVVRGYGHRCMANELLEDCGVL